MSISVDTVNLRFNVKPDYDQQQLQQLQSDLKDGQRELEKTRRAMDKLAKNGLKAMTKEQRAEYDKLSSSLSKQAAEVHRNEMRMKEWTRSANLSKLSISQLGQRAKDLTAVLNNLNPKSEEFGEYKRELDAVKNRMKELKSAASETQSSLTSFVQNISYTATGLASILALKDRVVSWADQYVQSFAKMDDAMTDVMKYTGQTKNEVADMNEEFKKMTTRTPREELNELAGAAGRLGIQGKENIAGFVDAADKINVALGDDLGEGAIDQIGKLTMVFGEDKTKGLNGAMLATGSAINELGASSSANTGFITEFTSRVAGMAMQAKISQTDIMGYASALSQAGVEGEVASGVFAQFVTKMFTDPAKFAKAAGLDIQAFTNLLKTDANQAILQFLEAMQQKGGFDQLAPMLKSLKMQGTQAIPVLTSMAAKLTELKEAQDLAAKAYEEGTSIINEFDNANSSAAAKLEQEEKKLNDVKVALGQELMPIIAGSINLGTTVLKVITKLIKFANDYKLVILALTTTIGYYTVAAKAAAIKTALFTAATNAARIATFAFNVVVKANPIGLMVGALATAVAWLTTYTQKTKEARKAQEELNKASLNADGTVKSDPTVKKRNQLDEIVVVGHRKKKEPKIPDSGGNNKQNKVDKERKEAEALAKQAFEREKIMLKQQYQGKKDLQDEWHLKEVAAERSYLNELAGIRDKYHASESERMEVANQALDNIAKEANIREEMRKHELAEKLKDLDSQQFAEQITLSRQKLDGEIKTQEEYDQKKLELEVKYQQQRINLMREGSDEYIAAQKQMAQLELQQLQQKRTAEENFIKSYQNTNNSILQNHLSEASSFDKMLELNQQYYDQDLISFQQYQQNKTMIAQQEEDARQAIQQAAIDTGNQLLQSAGQLFSLMQNREVSAVEKRYKSQINAAKKAGKDTTKLEEQMEAEKAAIQKKYAQKQFKLQVLQIIAATAQSIANVWKTWSAQPAIAAALSALAAAQGAIQLATAKAQADQAAGLYEGGYSEGYTAKGDPHKQAGVIPVHQNEFVANHHAVANPEIRPLLDVIDRHQKIGDIRMLNSTRMLEEAYGGGRARGGYTNSDDPSGDPGITFRREDDEVMQLLRAIESNTADSLTVRELRKKIKQEERLEQNASR
ncbi:phage tail tape measure protein, TP901 family, core region [Xylanibacter ruminicola]|nr:phage tail tape measure protein, TP901 family, core region [Xylanibacter ruminicola]